jgi:hypothetical protein
MSATVQRTTQICKTDLPIPVPGQTGRIKRETVDSLKRNADNVIKEKRYL